MSGNLFWCQARGEASSGYLVAPIVDRVAIVPDEDDKVVLGDRYHPHRSGVIDDGVGEFVTGCGAYPVLPETVPAALPQVAAIQCLPHRG